MSSEDETTPIFHRALKTPNFEEYDGPYRFELEDHELGIYTSGDDLDNGTKSDLTVPKLNLESLTNSNVAETNPTADENNGNSSMMTALSRMEQELGFDLGSFSVLDPPRSSADNDTDTETIVDFQSISLELTNTPPPSPLELKRREIPELSPHRSSEDIANLGNNANYSPSLRLNRCRFKPASNLKS